MERELDIKRYLPPYFDDIKEMDEIAKAENIENIRFYQELEDRKTDRFILTSTIQGIKRYEKLFEIKPDLRRTLEERRMEILRRWCLSLPYTYKKLIEQLQALTKENSFYIWRRFDQYEIEIHVLNQTLATLHSIRRMVRDMIPANLVLCYAGRYLFSHNVSIQYHNTIHYPLSFFPRYNIPFLYFDGTWFLDGKRNLNGYYLNILPDLYPLSLNIQGDYDVKKHIQIFQCFKNHISQQVKVAVSQIKIYKTIKQTIHQELIKCNIKQEIIEKNKLAAFLTIENDLWFLDDTYMLNGEKPLDADIFYYDL